LTSILCTSSYVVGPPNATSAAYPRPLRINIS
jgi:hypothetical protein